MKMKQIYFAISFLFLGSVVFSQEFESNTMWHGVDGILQQNLQRGASTQLQIEHTILNATNLSDWEIENTVKEDIDEAYASFLNRFISIYTSKENPDSYSWYRYSPDGKINTQLRRPFNRINIIITVNIKDVQTKTFSDVMIWFVYVDPSGKEVRRTDQEMRGFSTANFNRIALALNRNLKEVGVSIPSDGTGFPRYSLDRIVQKPLRTIEQYYVEGLLPDQVNPPPSDMKR